MSSLDAFVDLIGHDLEIIRYAGQNGRWSCSIRYAEVMERGMLGSLFGNGKTPEKAMADYARQIAGKRIAINAGTSRRKEYDVPADLVGGDAREEKNTVRVRVAVEVNWDGWPRRAYLLPEGSSPKPGPYRTTVATLNALLPESVAEVEATIDAKGRGGDAPKEKNTVRVRVAVEVNWNGCPTSAYLLPEGRSPRPGPYRTTVATLNAFLPEPVAEVEATIEAGNGGAATDTSEGKERELDDR